MFLSPSYQCFLPGIAGSNASCNDHTKVLASAITSRGTAIYIIFHSYAMITRCKKKLLDFFLCKSRGRSYHAFTIKAAYIMRLIILLDVSAEFRTRHHLIRPAYSGRRNTGYYYDTYAASTLRMRISSGAAAAAPIRQRRSPTRVGLAQRTEQIVSHFCGFFCPLRQLYIRGDFATTSRLYRSLKSLN